MTIEERQVLKEKKNLKREKYEREHTGGFELIYPTKDEELMKKYDEYLEVSKQVTHEAQGTVKRMIKAPEQISTAATTATSSGREK